MLDWNKISHITFEEIAFEYITDQYPTLQWTPTKVTRDGNKDGIAIVNNPLEVTISYWYEAKYSKNIKCSIAKSRLDSTLVSCLLDGTVAVIAFITNAYISEDYRRRAAIFSKKKDNLKIIYINGAELENWFNQNPKKEEKYFHEISSELQNLITKIDDFCLLEKHGLRGESFSKVKNIYTNQEYVLYISFYSTKMQTISVESRCNFVKIIDPYNMYDDYNTIRVNRGFNSIFIPILVSNKPNTDILFTIITESDSFTINIDNISVITLYTPKIMYHPQDVIEQASYRIINSNSFNNTIISIIGDMGTGKTYLLEKILNDSKNPFSSYVFAFQGDDLLDTLNCFKIILMTFYGDIWNYSEEKIIIDRLNDIEQILYSDIIQGIISNDSVQTLINYYKTDKTTVKLNKSMIQIFIDDFYKLSTVNQELLNTFFNWFLHQNYNCKIFVFSRMESIPRNCSIKYEISNISPVDVMNTVKANFNNIILADVIKNYPLPLNILHLILILSKINESEDFYNSKSPIKIRLLLNDIFSVSKYDTVSVLGSQLLNGYKDNKIVYTVYKIKSGISIDAIEHFFEKDDLCILNKLIKDRIIKEKNDFFLPYHDILLSSFEPYNNTELDIVLEKFVVFAENNKYITKGKFFSVLLGIESNVFGKYRREAELYRDLLHKKAAYNEALEIAKAIEKINNKGLDDYTAKDCHNLFIKANCIKYTESHAAANKEFEKICKIYEITKNIDMLGIYLEAETEIVNDYIWLLEIDKAEDRLNKIYPILMDLYQSEYLTSINAVYAFLNYYNRKMFINYMLDKGTKKDFDEAIFYSRELQQDNYEAFAMINFAKCLYFENLESAKNLLTIVHTKLRSLDEPRRELDVQAELWFINCISKKHINIDTYFSLLKKANLKHYTHTATKLKLKFVMLELLYTDKPCEVLKNMVYDVMVNNASIASGKRSQMFINHLLAAINYKAENINESLEYSNACLNFLSKMGTSYTALHKNNINVQVFNGFLLLHQWDMCKNQIYTSNKFVLDTRLW